jgi:hypothetical protein
MASGIGNGLAKIGDIKATIGLLTSPILAILFCCIGWWLIGASKGDGVHTQTVTGNLQNATMCSPNSACTGNVSYVVNSNTYSINATLQMGKQVNTVCQVAYNPSNPEDAIINNEPPSFMGYLFICIGFLVPLIAYGIYYATTHSKLFAQIEGANTVFGAVKSL